MSAVAVYAGGHGGRRVLVGMCRLSRPALLRDRDGGLRNRVVRFEEQDLKEREGSEGVPRSTGSTDRGTILLDCFAVLFFQPLIYAVHPRPKLDMRCSRRLLMQDATAGEMKKGNRGAPRAWQPYHHCTKHNPCLVGPSYSVRTLENSLGRGLVQR